MDYEVWKSLLAGLVRWALFALGTYLVKWGIFDQTVFNDWVGPATISLTGLIVIALTILWKYMRTRFQKATLAVALASPSPMSESTAKAIASENLSKGA